VGEHVRLSVSTHRQGTDAPDLSSAYPTEFARIGELRSPFADEPLALVAADRFSNRTSSSSIAARLAVDRALTAGYLRRQFTQTTGVGGRPEYTQYDAEAPHVWETAYATYRFSLLPELGSEAELNYSTYAKQPTYAYNNAFSGFEPQYKYSKNESFTFRQQLSYQPLEMLDLVVGFSWTRVHAAPETGGVSSPVDPDLPPGAQGLTIPGTSLAFPFYDLTYQVLGTYLQAQAQLLPSLSVTAGLRYDHDSRYGHTVNPRAGIVYELAPRHTAKFLYGESFLAPPPAYQYAFWGSFAGTHPDTGRAFAYWYHVPNPDLGPLKARTAELNYTALLSDNVLVEADAYLTAVEGLIVRRTADSPTTFAGADVLSYEQYRTEGRGRYYGGSATVRYQGRVGPLQLEPWGAFIVSRGRVLDAPDQGWLPLAHNFPYKLKGGLTLQYDRLSLTPRVRWAARSTQAAVSEAQPTQRLTVPSSTVVDTALRVDDLFTRGLSVTLDVRNVLDARYYQPGVGGTLDFAVNPQDPRSAMLQLAYALD